MLTAEHYRARAIEYALLLENARSSTEKRMFQELKDSYLSLAENMEGLAINRDKTIEPRPESTETARDNILQCLGAAVIMRWNTIPTKLQRELFEDASTIDDVHQTAPLKDALARFLHDHKDDARQPKDRA
jgi:hypothetical protein